MQAPCSYTSLCTLLPSLIIAQHPHEYFITEWTEPEITSVMSHMAWPVREGPVFEIAMTPAVLMVMLHTEVACGDFGSWDLTGNIPTYSQLQFTRVPSLLLSDPPKAR